MTDKQLPQAAEAALSGEDAAGEAQRMRDALHHLRIAEADISERYFWLETIVNQIPDYIYAKDLEGRFLFANRVTVVDNDLNHLSELIGKTDFDLHGEKAGASIAETERRVIETGEADLGIEEKSLRGPRDRWLMMSRIPLKDTHGRTIGVVGVSRDITARKAAEHLMQAQARLLEMMAQGMALDTFLAELIGLVEDRLDDFHAAIFVRSGDGATLRLAAAPSLPPAYRDQIWLMPVGPDAPSCGRAAYSGETVINSDLAATSAPMTGMPAAEHGYRTVWSVPIRSQQGQSLGTISFFSANRIEPGSQHGELIAIAVHLARIAIEKQRAEERINYLADHDVLTGLPNRAMLDRALERSLDYAARFGGHVVVAFLDLDNFKLINDSLGHACGDELLKVTAARMAAFIGPGDMVVRVGGDEFIIVMTLPDIRPETVMASFETLRTQIAAPVRLEGMEFQVTSSMGIACFPDHGRTGQELLANADAAMYRSKATGRDRLTIFSRDMADGARLKLERIEEMRRALRHQEFELHYQPQRNMVTGAVTGMEALLRWRHPFDGMVSPGEFIPLAEESGLIVALGSWVLNEACRQARRWQLAGMQPLVVSVNVSPRQFRETGWVDQVAAALEESGLAPQWLELEITESLIMDDMAGAVARMRELAALGIKLAIDDFGTGYSSLSALKSFPVSRLKIDRSFVADIPDDEDDMAITAAIISLAQKLGLEVIAEGVETEAQAAFLKESGCAEMQGFLFSRPLPASDFAVFMGLPAEPEQKRAARVRAQARPVKTGSQDVL